MRSEFQFLKDLRETYNLGHIGDDCAILPMGPETDLLLTADLLVEDIDFRLEWAPAGAIGHKALAVSLSDIAAMGGTAKWAMLSLGVPAHLWKSDFLDEFYEGWHKLAHQHNVELVGGDISKAPDKLIIDSIVGGEVRKGTAITRSGALAGDLIAVTGSLGGGAGGLRLLDGVEISKVSTEHHGSLKQKQLQPEPQLSIGKLLYQSGLVHSMIDVSDGLSSDLALICQKSLTGARIYAEKIPVNPDLEDLAWDEQLDLALNGGEDFELLFTADPKKISGLDHIAFTVIGEITANIGNIELINNGKTSDLPAKGYTHF